MGRWVAHWAHCALTGECTHQWASVGLSVGARWARWARVSGAHSSMGSVGSECTPSVVSVGRLEFALGEFVATIFATNDSILGGAVSKTNRDK